MEGMQSGQSQIIHQLLDAGLMGHRRMGIGAAAGGLGGIFAPLTMHVVHLFSPLVIGLEIAVTQGPGWRNAVEVMKLLKILLPQPEVGRAVHLGGPTDEVMAAWLKRLAVLVVPHILGDVAPLLEDLLRIPVLGFLREPVATLQHQNLQAAGGQVARQGAAAGTAADDHHIKVGPICHLQLAGIRQWRNCQGRTRKLGAIRRMSHG